MTDQAPHVPAINMERQAALNLQLPNGVTVVGCGGVGSWLALLLALAGVPRLYLFDHDTVSDHNLNRLPVTREWIGKDKSEAVAALIKQLRPDCDVWPLGEFTIRNADSLAIARNTQWIVATTDTLASRRLVHDYTASKYLNYLEVAAEGDIGTISGSPAEWATEAEAQPGYASVPVWVGPCVSAATTAVSFIIHRAYFEPERVIHTGWALRGTATHSNDPDYNYYDIYFHDTAPYVTPALTPPQPPQPPEADVPLDILGIPIAPPAITIGAGGQVFHPFVTGTIVHTNLHDLLNTREQQELADATIQPHHGDDWQVQVRGEMTITDDEHHHRDDTEDRRIETEHNDDDEPDSDEESEDTF